MIMKKILRLSLVAIVTLICNVAFADAYKTLTFPDENSANNQVSSYTDTWTAKIGNDSWIITNFNNNKWQNWSYIKCGRNNYESVASIATDFAVDQAISNVVVTIDKITASKVNSMALVVASDKDFSNVIETVNASDVAAGDIVFKTTKSTANNYYKLVFDCASASSNGVIQISKVEYYKAGDEPEIVDISNTPETAYTIAKAHELIEAGEGLATNVYVKGYITAITEVSTQYGNATYDINDTKDATEGSLNVYRGYYLNGDKFTSEDQIKVGDEVIIYGQLSVYGTTHQIASGSSIYSINESATSVSGTTVEKFDANAPVYNLAGQRVSKNTKGILIQNGKKFVNK